MPTTTNFGWTTPADTDYVKDGALAIRTLGNGIDTSLVDLKGGTSGQYLVKNSNTDLDFTWTTNTADIDGITATSPLTGGGTSGTITVGIQDGTTAQKGAVQLEDSTSSTSTTKAATPNSVKSAYDLAGAAVAKSLIDAEGDLIVGDAADAVQRLAIGSNGNVLTVDTSVDGKIKWAAPAAGGAPWSLISTTTLSGSSTTISSIGTSYNQLFLLFFACSNSAGDSIRVRINNDSGSNYDWYHYRLYSGTATYTDGSAASSIRCSYDASTSTSGSLLLSKYDSTEYFFTTHCYASNKFDISDGKYNGTAAATSLVILSASGTNSGTVYLFGA